MKKLVCEKLQLQRSVIYYKNKDNKPGIKPSVLTVFNDELVTDETVNKSVKGLLH